MLKKAEKKAEKKTVKKRSKKKTGGIPVPIHNKDDQNNSDLLDDILSSQELPSSQPNSQSSTSSNDRY